jgi:RNA polymerase sigma-70 factor (ECF subfamily)
VAERFDPEPFRAELLAFARRVGPASDAEDAVQEAFLRSVASPPSSAPRAWLYRVTLNCLRDLGRRERRFDRAAPDLVRAGRPADPAAEAEARDLADAAWRAVAGLPEGARVAVTLRVRHLMDYAEVAEVLGCSVPTARQHFHLGIKAVRDALAEKDDG